MLKKLRNKFKGFLRRKIFSFYLSFVKFVSVIDPCDHIFHGSLRHPRNQIWCKKCGHVYYLETDKFLYRLGLFPIPEEKDSEK